MCPLDDQKAREPSGVLIDILEAHCKGCELCVLVCPRGCLQLDRTAFNDSGHHPVRFAPRGPKGPCTACGICYMVCPDYAIAAIKTLKGRERAK